MPFDERLITVAIHTCEHAIVLKDKLERNGIFATLQNINLEHPVVASGMRVRIKESDLAKALLIIESEQDASTNISNDAEANSEILVPVDFSTYSFEAALVAYRIAHSLGAKVTLLHAFYSTMHASMTQLSDALTYDKPIPESSTEAIERANQSFTMLRQEIDKHLSDKIKGAVKTKMVIERGLPEDVVNQYSKTHKPILIVMGTRGADKKGKDSIGSVTAEVLDTCRRPVLTVPEGLSADSLLKNDQLLYICNGEQSDILALQKINELLDGKIKEATLASLQNKHYPVSSKNLESLCQYCSKHFPGIKFSIGEINVPDNGGKIYHPDIANVGLIVIPNKRKSVFSRFFNPGIAQRLLFRADIPMMVMPV